MLGLETAVPIILEFVRTNRLDARRALWTLTGAPARAFGLAAGSLAIGAAADVCVIDPGRHYTIVADGLRSKSKNSPFDGRPVQGRATKTIVGGRVVYDSKD